MDGFTVYRHIFPNGKSYIGVSSNVFKRWGKFGEGYSGQRVYSAIKKYGWGNIKHEILAYGLTEEEAKKLEQQYIEQYYSHIDLYGYNVTFGGDHFSEPYKIVLKYSLSGELLGRYCGLKEAANSIGTDMISTISSCCNHDVCTSHGYIWRYEDDPNKSFDIPDFIFNKSRQVDVYDICNPS